MSRFFLLSLALLIPGASAQSPPATPGAVSPADAARADVALLEYVGGSPLTSAEKQEVAAFDAEGLRSKPKSFQQGYANAQVALTLATYHNPYANAESIENWRRDLENQPETDTERSIIDRHDPVVALRRGRNASVTDIVTERSLQGLNHAAVWASSGAGLPPPPRNLIAAERDALKRSYDSYSLELQTAYAHIGRNFAAAAAFFAEVKPAQAQSFLRARLTAKQVTDPAATTALLVQDLYNEVLRRGINPTKLSLRNSNDPLLQMYTYNARRDAWQTINP